MPQDPDITDTDITKAIVAGPVNIKKLIEGRKPPQDLVNSLFTNFLAYAKKNWSYIASSKDGGEALLTGKAKAVPCGGIANAFRMLVRQVLGIEENEVEYITISGYVVTGPDYLSYDPKVIGNIRLAESPANNPKSYNQGCIFNEHYYLRVLKRYYDPCLSSAYETKDASVIDRPEVIFKGEFMKARDNSVIYAFNKEEKVNGWQQGAWMTFQPKDIAKYMKEKDVEATIKKFPQLAPKKKK